MKLFPRVNNLTAVKNGKGYVVGKLSERHKFFDYLHKDALCVLAGSVGSVFKIIDDLGWKPRNDRSSDDSGGSNFQSFDNLATALDVFKNNARSVRKFKEADTMLQSQDDIGRDVRFDVTGDYIDIGRFLEGDPECFGVAVNGNPSSLAVNVIYNINAVSYVTEEALNLKQSKILEVVDWFESRNVRCRILAFASSQCAHLEIVVKDYQDAVNMNDLAVVGHSDFLRRVLFLIDEQSDTWQSGYGNPRYFTQTMNNHYKADPNDGLTIYVDDQSTNDLDNISKQFENVKNKIADVISSPEKRDFSKVYMVQL